MAEEKDKLIEEMNENALVKYVESEGRLKSVNGIVKSDITVEEINERFKRKKEGESGDKPKSNVSKSESNSFFSKLFNIIHAKKIINYEELGYPKVKDFPIDIELVEGEQYNYFNIEKYLKYKNKSWILKVIPLHILDKLTYNKPIFDRLAPKLRQEVTDYNNMNVGNQYEYDEKQKYKKWTTRFGMLVFTVLVVLFAVIPGYQSSEGKRLLGQRKFQDAYAVYSSKSSLSDLDAYYKQYSLAMGYLEAGNYVKAKEELLKLEGVEAPNVSLDDSMQEILYKEGRDFAEKKEYIKAAGNFKITYNYKDSKDRFLESSYLSIDQLMKEEKYDDVMISLDLLRDYKDSQVKGGEVKEIIYQKAHEAYNNKKYDVSAKLFSYVSQSNYKDSKTMIYQAQYNAGVTSFKQKDYAKALDQLEELSWFKDASGILSEIYYIQGTELRNKNKTLLAYDKLINAIHFRDTESIISNPDMVLFGDWRILSYNSSYVKDVNINFNTSYMFNSNAIDSIYLNELYLGKAYTYKDGKYILNDSIIRVIPNGINNITLAIDKGGASTTLALRRISPIAKNNAASNNNIRTIIEEYINKKIK